MQKINVHEAKTRLSELLARVECGEEFVIARAGKPIALLCQLGPARRQPGYLPPEYRITEEFDRGNEEIAELFERSEIFPG